MRGMDREMELPPAISIAHLLIVGQVLSGKFFSQLSTCKMKEGGVGGVKK